MLRPAKDENEKKGSQQVSVTLAGDEQRLLHQTASGSIIVDTAENEKKAQTIIPFGKMIECLGCTLRWTRGGIHLHHPRFGRIRTRLKGGCPEIVDEVQAAAIITELEMKQVEELKARTQGLQDQLNAIKALEVRNEDWRVLLAKYVVSGRAVDGLQALHKSPVFEDLPGDIKATTTPNLDRSSKAGWEYLKLLYPSQGV